MGGNLQDDIQTTVDLIKTETDKIATVVAAVALSGDAAVANVLSGKTFYKDDCLSKLTGTMANNAGDVASVSAHMDATTNLHVVPATGYTDGVDDATTVDLAVVDTDLVAGNVKHGVALLGVTGAYDTEAGSPIAAGTVLDSKVGFVNGSKITGTMPNNAGDVASVSAHMDAGTVLHVVPAAGYTDGSDDVSTVDLATVDADLAAGNVKTGVAVLGVTGTYDTEAGSPIAAGTVLDSKVGFVNGAKITGTMPNNAGAVAAVSASITAGTTLSVIAAEGYMDGSDDTSTIDLTTVDGDLVTGNIKAGVTILGVAGTVSVVDTADANAVEADIASGKTAYVNGVKITGTHV